MTALQLAQVGGLPRLRRESALGLAVVLVLLGPLGDVTLFPWWRR